MINFSEVRIPVTLDQERTMIFNANTMARFEEVTNKFYFDVLLNFFDIYAQMRAIAPTPEEQLENDRRAGMNIIRRVSVSDLRALVHAAIHEYDGDKPRWPLSVYEVGRYLTPLRIPTFLHMVLRGHSENAPKAKEMGESTPEAVASPAPPVPKAPVNGGILSTELPADAFK